MKKCNRCKSLKPLTDFYENRQGNKCKECIKKINKSLYRKKVLNIHTQPVVKNDTRSVSPQQSCGNIDEFFEEGYQDRIKEYIIEEIIPSLDKSFIKNKRFI